MNKIKVRRKIVLVGSDRDFGLGPGVLALEEGTVTDDTAGAIMMAMTEREFVDHFVKVVYEEVK